jgi:hypothetical protein
MITVNLESNLLDALQKQLNVTMLNAAEPLIQQALQDIERAMREKLAQRLIALLQNDLRINRMGTDLHIVVHQALKDRG